MENQYQEKLEFGAALSTAFTYWSRTLSIQLLYSLIYFSLFFLGYFYLFNYFGLWEEFSKYSDLARTDFPAFNKKMEEIAQLPASRNFALGIFVLSALINPLNVGFYKIYRKIDLQEKPTLNDFFAGYLGFDFFRFFGFYLFWIVIFAYANALLFLGVFWFLITLFSVPLLFFMDVKTFPGIALTLAALKKNFSTVLISVLAALLFSISGLLVFGIGFLFTFPFWHAMIYTLYSKLYREND